jgi:valyl-tRNA synthetase
MKMHDKFTPQLLEDQLYAESESYFKADLKNSASPYTVMMPPPNVTGSLHLGHALTYTLQDILIRFKRSMGFDALWQPGTDHAGIATQMVVERQLAEQGQSRHDLGRAEFLKKIWEWKEYSGNAIVTQQRRLRISADWDRSRFTMDEGLSKAVVEVFVRLYKEKLIYRDKRLVNWDTKMLTAVSDLEVITKEEKKPFWYIKYPLADNPQEHIVIATTRPETMFGDTAVAVNPEDERYKKLVGRKVLQPLTGRTFPIIADDYCDMEKGSGAVKITPAHDFNDFEMGKRHNLEHINVFDERAHLNDMVPEAYRGMYYIKARVTVVADLEEQGFLDKADEITGPTPYGERSGVELQPYLTDQWFVDAAVLAKPALDAVKTGKIKFVPQHWENTYFEWLNNIQPWCISRQIWWGHQIPAWFGPGGEIFVEKTEEEAYAVARQQLGNDVILRRETDVLDTWFSSALWPFTTLGWPEKTPELSRYYPTDTLVTGFDIIFFWVARMIMMGIHFMGDIPFRTVYIHALVRDEKGQKMSKSKGNVIDPLILMDKYGSDVVRYTLAALAAPGRDIKLGENRIEGYRNFCTKIWNAARFLEMNGCQFDKSFSPHSDIHPINQWIAAHLLDLKDATIVHLNDHRFDLAAQGLYQSFWYVFCDQYLEALKVLLQGDQADASKKMAMWALFEYLSLLHPIMPSITSYLAKYFGMHECLTNYKVCIATSSFAPNQTNTLWRLIDEVRSLKGLLNISGGVLLKAYIKAEPALISEFTPYISVLSSMARFSSIEEWNHEQPPAGSLPCVVQGFTLYMGFDTALDVVSAKSILSQKQESLEKEAQHLEKKLQNEAYKNAKPDQWQEDKDMYSLKVHEGERLAGFLKLLGTVNKLGF